MYIISNVMAILFLLAAWKKPVWARILFFLLFAWAGITNWRTATGNPQVYTEYADLSFLSFYRTFILGWFRDHASIMVKAIAVCQLLISVSMLAPGRLFTAGAMGAILFLLAIAPLGVGSAFPCSVVLALGLALLVRKKQEWLVRLPNKNHAAG